MKMIRPTKNQSEIKTNAPISFSSWDGNIIEVTLKHIDFWHDPTYACCSITFSVDADRMDQMVKEEWFHLFSTVITGQASFEPGEPVEVRAILSPSIARIIAMNQGDAETVLAALLPGDVTSASVPSLAAAEYWYVRDALQSVKLPPALQDTGAMRIGFRTSWQDIFQDVEQPPHQQATPPESDLASKVEAFLHAQKLNYERLDERLIRIRFQSERRGSWILLVRMEAEKETIVLYSVFPERIPPSMRQELALLLMSENYELLAGAFEMDQEDGELRFRSSLVGMDKWNGSAFGNSLSSHIQVMEMFLPVIKQMVQVK